MQVTLLNKYAVTVPEVADEVLEKLIVARKKDRRLNDLRSY